ncbi:MAG TPA: PIN domain-containing protein [Baekduia sp.]
MTGLLDTSVVIAMERGRPLATELLPDEALLSAVTIGELETGVHTAADDAERERRLGSLSTVRSEWVILPVDTEVAAVFGRLRAGLRGTGRRVRLHDLWIAATARAHGLPLYTQDADFEAMGIDVVRV